MGHQTVNMRAGVPRVVATAGMQREYEAECAARRSVMTVEFEVAPRCDVATLRGVLGAGSEVTLADFEDVVDAGGRVLTPAWRRFELLVQGGHVLARI